MEVNNVYKGDCLELMKDIETGSIDMILCDLPYGVTRNGWDKLICLENLWYEYSRIISNNGVIVLTAQQPFSSMLISTNYKMFKYSTVWVKGCPTGFLNSNYAPLRKHEDVLIFSKASACFVKDKSNAMCYNPQGLQVVNKINRRGGSGSNYDKCDNSNFQKYTNYPTSVISLGASISKKLHPTQKPVPLLEYLIKTYSNEGELVLDNCAGSGSTGVACQNTKRKYILMEKEQKYYDIIIERLAENQKKLNEQLF